MPHFVTNTQKKRKRERTLNSIDFEKKMTTTTLTTTKKKRYYLVPPKPGGKHEDLYLAIGVVLCVFALAFFIAWRVSPENRRRRRNTKTKQV